MTTIQAYKRAKPYAHVFPDLSLLLEFKPNSIGDVVCDVEHPVAVERLLAVPTGFRVYAAAPASEPVITQPLLKTGDTPPPGDADSKYILKAGETTFDLRTLNEEQLREFAKANNIAVHHAAKAETIRDKIVDALKADTGAGA